MNLSGSLYHKTQVDFAYNTNHIEGSTNNSWWNCKYLWYRYYFDKLWFKGCNRNKESFYFILKDGTLTDSERVWFNVGEYKKKKNFVGNIKRFFQVM